MRPSVQLTSDAERLRQCPFLRPVLFEDTDRSQPANNAAGWLGEAQDYVKKGRLPRTVAADEADTLRIERKRQIME
jgi:hypothetical protein